MPLPINVDDLITGQSIEWERLEFKEGWNPISILHSICAFANDINNWGGGYIVIGIKEENGRPLLPPQGLDPEEIDNMQKKLIELCHHITPHYFPLAVPKIRRKLKQNGSPDPLFQTDEQLTYFLTILYSHPDFTGQDKDFKENATVSATVNTTVNETQRKILEKIEKKSSITYVQLAVLLKKERTTIYRNIKKMVEMNIIKRLGSDKNGHWEMNREMLSAIGYRGHKKK